MLSRLAPGRRPVREKTVKRLTLRVPHDLWEQLRTAAYERRISLNALIVDLLRKSFR